MVTATGALELNARHKPVSARRLGRALDRGELELHYQPIVELVCDGSVDPETAELAGLEALLRWHHPDQGLVPPQRFITDAEDTGAIVPIGAWVLEKACTQMSWWRDRREPVSSSAVHVNVSTRQLDERTIIETVETALDSSGLTPEALILEITESALIRDQAATVEILRALKKIGIVLAIDDFGTGYASMTCLQQCPVDILKIDRSFVGSLGVDVKGEVIVGATIELAHSLGLRVVAEGVETHSQVEALRFFGCELAQGFLFSRPRPAEDLDELRSIAPA